MAQVRYIVDDVNVAVKFYTEALRFDLVQQYGPAMAIVRKDDLSLWLAGPLSSAAKSTAQGQVPKAGGWARIVLVIRDLDEMVSELKERGVIFRSEIADGPAGRQALFEDPSGNAIELFEPRG